MKATIGTARCTRPTHGSTFSRSAAPRTEISEAMLYLSTPATANCLRSIIFQLRLVRYVFHEQKCSEPGNVRSAQVL